MLAWEGPDGGCFINIYQKGLLSYSYTDVYILNRLDCHTCIISFAMGIQANNVCRTAHCMQAGWERSPLLCVITCFAGWILLMCLLICEHFHRCSLPWIVLTCISSCALAIVSRLGVRSPLLCVIFLEKTFSYRMDSFHVPPHHVQIFSCSLGLFLEAGCLWPNLCQQSLLYASQVGVSNVEGHNLRLGFLLIQ